MRKLIPGNLINEKLKIKRKSILWLSQRVGCSYRHMRRICNQEIDPLTSLAIKIASTLGCQVEEVFFYRD